jgi:hypothetical protein
MLPPGQNQQQIRTLSTLLDTLLPRLISGRTPKYWLQMLIL